MSKRKIISRLPCSQKTKQQKSLASFFSSSSKGTSKSKANETNSHPYHIFIDLDGVLVDFQSGLRRLFPKYYKNTDEPDIPKKVMWMVIGRTPSFYRDLPWTSDGRDLWKALKQYTPEILTGVSMSKSSRTQKFEWCSREFQRVEDDQSSHLKTSNLIMNHVDMAGGKQSHKLSNNASRLKRDKGVINVITCWSRNKHCESGHNRVLIDDRADLGIQWKEKGGIFIHHTDTETTLKKLRDANIIPLVADNTLEKSCALEEKDLK